MGWSFKRLFASVSDQINAGFRALFARFWRRDGSFDKAGLQQALMQADIDTITIQKFLQSVEHVASESEFVSAFTHFCKEHIQESTIDESLLLNHQGPKILFLVGINGSGKTTTAAKIAHTLVKRGITPWLVAADTFRVAAQEQLAAWGAQQGVRVVAGVEGGDPGAVIYTACQSVSSLSKDAQNNIVLIVDTAGRLQTKAHLMRELGRLVAIAQKKLPQAAIATWLVIDSTLGMNTLSQAKLFHESVPLNGLVLTKMDSGAKGGMIISIGYHLRVPIVAIATGENNDALSSFDVNLFINSILYE